jgi:hypothetical protein
MWRAVLVGAVRVCVWPNVRAKPTVEEEAGRPRKDNINNGLEPPDGAYRGTSAP